MKLYTAMVYVVARVEVTYALLTRHIASDNECEDTLPLSLIPSVARGDGSDRVLAEIDQDGFTFAVDDHDAKFFNTSSTMNARRHSRIEMISRGGAVYLRKTAIRKRHPEILARLRDFLGWEFYIEAAALLRLRGLPCVPSIRRIDCRERTIEMDYIWERDLRQVLANGRNEIAYDEISRLFLALVAKVSQNETSAKATEILISVIRRGVIPRDVHAANFIQVDRSNKLYMVDFNLAYLRPVPGWRSHVRNLAWVLKDRTDEVCEIGSVAEMGARA
jgi:tRNA A-37 threonylcarbamoyl transferase component Bud32